MQHELSVLALTGRTREQFIYVFDDESREALVAHLYNQAANPNSALTWLECAVLVERARMQPQEEAPMTPRADDS